ncbi:RNA polymerase sigma factor [Oceanobacillus sp. CAU 1775]
MNLVDRLKNKEEAAIVELMNQYGDYLLRMAFLLLKDHQTAEEVVQDTFLIAYEKIAQLENEAVLKSWLTTITINQSRQRMRKWSWKNIFLQKDDKEQIFEDENVEGPEDSLLEIEFGEGLATAIHTLDYKYREVITLFYFNELKISEIANLIEVKENTIKSRLKRGRELLKAILLEKEELTHEGETTNKRTIG